MGTVSRRALTPAGFQEEKSRSVTRVAFADAGAADRLRLRLQMQTQQDGVKLEAGGSRVGIKVYEGKDGRARDRGLTESQLSLTSG